MKTCAREGCENPVPDSKGFTERKFCSNKCRDRYNDAKRRERRKQAYIEKPKHQLCIDCGADITHRGPQAIRCEQHAQEAKTVYRKRWDTNHPNYDKNRRPKTSEAEDIAAARAGLAPLHPGRIQCSCGRWFQSWDIKKNRFCDHCQLNHERLDTASMG